MSISQKAVRFSVLIQSSGRPHVATLWGDPQKDRSFTRAIHERRVMTVQQNRRGSDFGTIGFHQDKNVSYFVFPNALRQAEGTHVIGIKYDLLAASEPVGEVIATPTKEKKPKTRPPEQKSFAVTVKTTATIETALEIKAANASAAKEAALEKIKQTRFDPREAIFSHEVRSVEEKSR